MTAAATLPRPARLFWLFTFVIHAVVAMAWWWIKPGAFAFSNPHFWVNALFPWLVVGVVIAAFAAGSRDDRGKFYSALLIFPLIWASAAISALVVFPISAQLWFLAPLAIAVILGRAVLEATRKNRWPIMCTACVAIPAIVIGAYLPITQRAPSPGTHPIGVPFADGGIDPIVGSLSIVHLSKNVRVQPDIGLVSTDIGRVHLDLEPLLTFTQCSPDGCWTIFSPKSYREFPRQIMGNPQTMPKFMASYIDAGITRFTAASDEHDRIDLDSSTRLTKPIDSHLNTFCELTVIGHHRLSVVFSPCGNKPIDCVYSDYPAGRPERIAYLGADGVFRVVEAHSAEKGPFRELAAGPLHRGDPLTLTLLDEGSPVCAITLDDWSAQADTTPSPTAGWGLPANAIEFSLYSNSPKSAAGFWISLASTSVGTGWDTVAHAAGTYRDRIHVQPLP